VTLGGEVDGKRLLSQKTLDLIFEEQANGLDHCIGQMRFGIGFGLVPTGNKDVDDWMPKGKICFWGGWGGSIIVMDLDRKLTLAYDMNKMSNVGLGNKPAKKYMQTVYEVLDKES
jgi:CubicO group peptidase (beta-lactamase class C family)